MVCSAITSLDSQRVSNRDISSRNCTKHNCRCDYRDMNAAQGSPPAPRRGPDLLMSPEIEMEIDGHWPWQRTKLGEGGPASGETG